MTAITVRMSTDFGEFKELLERLSCALNKLGKLPFSAPDRFEDAFTLETDYGAAGASELIVRLKPTELFLEFAAAVFALDVD